MFMTVRMQDKVQREGICSITPVCCTQLHAHTHPSALHTHTGSGDLDMRCGKAISMLRRGQVFS